MTTSRSSMLKNTRASNRERERGEQCMYVRPGKYTDRYSVTETVRFKGTGTTGHNPWPLPSRLLANRVVAYLVLPVKVSQSLLHDENPGLRLPQLLLFLPVSFQLLSKPLHVLGAIVAQQQCGVKYL